MDEEIKKISSYLIKIERVKEHVLWQLQVKARLSSNSRELTLIEITRKTWQKVLTVFLL